VKKKNGEAGLMRMLSFVGVPRNSMDEDFVELIIAHDRRSGVLQGTSWRENAFDKGKTIL